MSCSLIYVPTYGELQYNQSYSVEASSQSVSTVKGENLLCQILTVIDFI